MPTSLRRTYHTLLTVFACLFMAMQTVSIAHAAQYADAGHDHNGIACHVDAVSSDQDLIIPAPISALVLVQTLEPSVNHPYKSTLYTSPQGRAPPPRAPPTLS